MDVRSHTDAWGHRLRYYSDPSRSPSALATEEKRAYRAVTDILSKIDPDCKDTVVRTYRQWNLILRDYLRNETGLRLSVGDDTRSIPVEVTDGLPIPFRQAIDPWLPYLQLILNRKSIDDAAIGLRLVNVIGLLPEYRGKTRPSDVASAACYVEWLSKHVRTMATLKQISEIREDVLGAYFFMRPEIHLYWAVIGTMAAALGVSTESLTVVVLCHELTHAYTHLGRDIDGIRWDTEAFSGTDLSIVEGLAQFYTDTICSKLGSTGRYPEAQKSFLALRGNQPKPYTIYSKWISRHTNKAEVVRATMVQCRRNWVTDYTAFRRAMGTMVSKIEQRRPFTTTLYS